MGLTRAALAPAGLIVLAAILAVAGLTGAAASLVVGALAGWALGRAGRAEARPIPSEAAPRTVSDAVLAHIPDPVILVDGRAVVLAANEAARALLPGLREGTPISFALRAPDVLAGIREVAGSGTAALVGYTERVPTERAFEVQLGALRDPAGGAQDGAESGAGPRIVLHFRDLTAARRLEAMRVDFVANASHELRTPLASLLGFIETLQGPARNDPAARERFLAIMRGQARRMARLVDDLLSLSRIELREHVAPRDPVVLAPVLRQVIEAHGPLAAEEGVALVLEGAEETVTVPGDRDELVRVVENLVENAVKYGGAGGRVEVGLALEGGVAEIRVRDHGPGIAPEHLPRLTERFYRVDAAESRQKGGTGLGLAIVKHILNRHGGRLVAESEPGQGATFRALLPVAAAARDAARQEARQEPRP